MTKEDDFQKALDAHPEDWQTRLVFADWLQERGDPRAEFLRLECEVTGLLPAAAPPRLRRRLEELCLVLDPDWISLVRREPIPDAVEAALAELGDMLAGVNYVTYLAIHRIPFAPDRSVNHVTAS